MKLTGDKRRCEMRHRFVERKSGEQHDAGT